MTGNMENGDSLLSYYTATQGKYLTMYLEANRTAAITFPSKCAY
jgi:hypothetical protein